MNRTFCIPVCGMFPLWSDIPFVQRARPLCRLLAVFGCCLAVLVGSVANSGYGQITQLDPKPIDLIPGLDESEIRSLQQTREWNPDSAVILRLLDRMKLFSPSQVFAYESSALSELPAPNQAARTEDAIKLFRAKGRVVGYAKHELSKLAKENYDFGEYYSIDINSSQFDGIIRVCVKNVPHAWDSHSPIGQLAGFDSFTVHRFQSENDPSETTWVMVAPEAKWFPDSRSESQGFDVNAGQLLLSKYGYDVGQFDHVRQRTQAEIGKQDSEAFLQSLSVAGEMLASKDGLRELAEMVEPLEMTSVFKASHPEHLESYGKAFQIRGNLRRITPVQVNSELDAERLGLETYYQLDVFVPIERPIRLVAKGKEPIVFENQYPVTVCVPSLPKSLQGKTDVSIDIEVNGFFFKLWSYYSVASRQAGSQKQIGPLIIGLQPEIVVQKPSNEINFLIGGAIAGILFVLAVTAIWYWRVNQAIDADRIKRKPDQIEIDLD